MWCHVIWLMYFVLISSILNLEEAGAWCLWNIIAYLPQYVRHILDDPNFNMCIRDKLFKTQFLG